MARAQIGSSFFTPHGLKMVLIYDYVNDVNREIEKNSEPYMQA
jgi:hypothetical protein